mgnify:CR=1 FL=1
MVRGISTMPRRVDCVRPSLPSKVKLMSDHVVPHFHNDAGVSVIEIGRNHVGVVGATMNSVGNLAAMLNPLIVAYSVEWFGSWNLPLYLMGVLFLLGAFCWTLVNPEEPVFGEDPVRTPPGRATAAARA